MSAQSGRKESGTPRRTKLIRRPRLRVEEIKCLVATAGEVWRPAKEEARGQHVRRRLIGSVRTADEKVIA